jgi:hypothetical protein
MTNPSDYMFVAVAALIFIGVLAATKAGRWILGLAVGAMVIFALVWFVHMCWRIT